jgi:malate synthase
MVINALNSGANIFMADFEDANSPTWLNMIEGQKNLIDAIKGTLTHKSAEGKEYRLNEKRATLMVRPRGWHLEEAHFLVDGEPISASLFDFGLYFFHNAKTLIEKGSGPYFYLPKLENHIEARLWNSVFIYAQEKLLIPPGTIRATVLLETILAAFEMEEILHELREHSAGLNAGRWDYIFSIIKKFRGNQSLLFPDRSQIIMTVPFLQAYTDLLVHVCHKRGAHAIGGMAAYIPSRKDKALNEVAMAKVKEDKLREVSQGFDGTWVAHPDLVPVAKTVFEEALKGAPHQKNRPPKNGSLTNSDPDSYDGICAITAKDLSNFIIPGGEISEDGVRKNISIALQYLQSWLDGQGAVGIYNLMEDVATAEISRAQLWQWVHHPNAKLVSGEKITPELYLFFADDEYTKLSSKYMDHRGVEKRLLKARSILDQIVLNKTFTDFMTIVAYDELKNL